MINLIYIQNKSSILIELAIFCDLISGWNVCHDQLGWTPGLSWGFTWGLLRVNFLKNVVQLEFKLGLLGVYFGLLAICFWGPF